GPGIAAADVIKHRAAQAHATQDIGKRIVPHRRNVSFLGVPKTPLCACYAQCRLQYNGGNGSYVTGDRDLPGPRGDSQRSPLSKAHRRPALPGAVRCHSLVEALRSRHADARATLPDARVIAEAIAAARAN